MEKVSPAKRVLVRPVRFHGAYRAWGWRIFCVLTVVLGFFDCGFAAQSTNRLYRFEAKSKPQYTRLSMVFDQRPRYQLSHLDNGQVQITFQNTAGTSLKKQQSFADTRVSGITITDLGTRLRVRFTCKEGSPALRVVNHGAANVVALDIGSPLQVNGEAAMPPGREQLWQGAAKLIHDFDPPLTTELPFFPMPGILLKKIMTPADLKLFVSGEAALFRERGAEAEELFTDLATRVPSARPLAAYRLGEAQYLLQKYDSAVRWFREGVRLAPQMMVQSPSIVFAYADSLARCGESEAGRKILDKMIVSMADTRYGPVLLVRLADLLKRGGRDREALAVYRSVAANFSGNRAALLASARLADRRLFQVNRTSYSALADEYKRIYQKAGDPILMEEALFKWALLNVLYGTTSDAVAAISEYGVKFPSGTFSNVAKSMHEDLLLIWYRELVQADNCQAMVKLVRDHRPYLSRCISESTFIPQISRCFTKLGMVREELELFSALAETAWAAQHRAFILERIVETAWELEDYALVAGAAKNFLQQYPRHGASPLVREHLAWILYRNRDLVGVYGTLLPIMSGRTVITDPQTFYFFGKACENIAERKKAEQAMSRYLAAMPAGTGTALAADARLVIASAMQSRKATGAALAVLQAGFDASKGDRRDMFLYKIGELLQASGKSEEAVARWQQLTRDGKDPIWRNLASQAIEDVRWRRSMGTTNTSK